MNKSEILIYQNSEGNIKIDVRLEEESVWLTQDQMANLFGKAKSTINEHIKNVYDENELVETLTMKKFGISEFQQKAPNYYNLDVIISVGYRVKSPQGTQFRIWATQRLKEYITKGFALNDERFKSGTSVSAIGRAIICNGVKTALTEESKRIVIYCRGKRCLFPLSIEDYLLPLYDAFKSDNFHQQ